MSSAIRTAVCVLVAVLLVACAGGPLRRHATALPDLSDRARVVDVLDDLDRLRAEGALVPGRADEICASLDREPFVAADDLVSTLDAEPRLSEACRRLETTLERARAVRDELEEAGNGAALDAIDAAVRELRPVDRECPAEGHGLVAVVAAAVRRLYALRFVRGGAVGLVGVGEHCNVATLGGPVEIGPPEPDRCRLGLAEVMRGDVLPDLPRAAPPDPPSVVATPAAGGGETTTYDFEDDLWLAPEDGPFANSPTVRIEMCRSDGLWLALLGARWHVIQHLHWEQ